MAFINWKRIVKKTHIILVGSILIFLLTVCIPNISYITSGELAEIVTKNPVNKLLFLIGMVAIIPVIFTLAYLIHFVFIPHFVAMVDPVVIPCRSSAGALFAVGFLLLFELFVPNPIIKNVFHTFALVCFIIHVALYYYVVRLCPFTMSFLRSRIQSLKVILSGNLVAALFCRLVSGGIFENLFDWFSVFLAVGIALCYFKDTKEFVINYYNDVESQNNVETLTDLDPLTMKELEEPSDIVTI